MSRQTLILSDKDGQSLFDILKKEPELILKKKIEGEMRFDLRDEPMTSLFVYPGHNGCRLWADSKCLIEYYTAIGPTKYYFDVYHKIKPHLGNMMWITQLPDHLSSEEPPEFRR